MSELKLWYRRPAAEWTQALPIGNGRLGAMVFGGVGRDELQLNESSLWSGGPYQPTNEEALPHLAAVRDLIFAQRFAEAHDMVQQHLLGTPSTQMSYQPVGSVFLEFGHEAVPGTYRRVLDLETATATTSYEFRGVGIDGDAPTTVTRTAFASAADDVIAWRIASSLPGSLSFELWFDSPQSGDLAVESGPQLSFRGQNAGAHGVEGRLRFGTDMRVHLTGGSIERRGRRLIIRDADAADIFVDIATSFNRYDDVSGDPDDRLASRRARLQRTDFAELVKRHVAAHQEQFQRFGLELGTGRDDLPTDERITGYAAGNDPGLAALYVQYGRYLSISSSRPGTQPANLQGIWSKDTSPPWGSKYTANINLQMNYWLPDPANLPRMMEPLIAMVEDLSEAGAVTAKAHYDARGWVLHHNTDLWRATAPIDGAYWGMWPMGGAWLMAQLWDHAHFEGFPADLVGRLYGPMRGAVLFMLDVLVPLPGTDYLVIAPSMSPENRHPFGMSVCAGPAMDSQILRDLFSAFVEAATQLQQDAALVAQVRQALSRLPSDRIGAAGQLQEWMEDWDMEAPERHHRHVSHLYALFPSRQIEPHSTPALAAAARKSLEIRGDDATGWGIGWRINLWARLRDAARAHDVLARLLSPERSYDNLFDAHPPFQIDGNFGGATGILEMLLQSGTDTIHILPALPVQWPSGSVTGIRARGGVSLDFSWQAGRLTHLVARSTGSYRGRVLYDGRVLATGLSAGTTAILPATP